MTIPIKTSGEDYLEAIYNLSLLNPKVRSVDVAKLLNISKPSVHKAFLNLVNQGYITKESYGHASLTAKGLEYAKLIKKKHVAIRKLLTEILGVSVETAEIDACKIEHHLSEETATKLFTFLKITD